MQKKSETFFEGGGTMIYKLQILDVPVMPSSVIAAMDYYPSSSTLRITFVSGTVYDYKHVPESIFKKMKAFTSKGTFFNQQIKGKYDFEKVK
ncbi:MAG TPA: KTSC domain-containing protein [Flavipsychrobacter sp.]|nr:KTSC domain-containing protein [Flavipsychrobacter sp.]